MVEASVLVNALVSFALFVGEGSEVVVVGAAASADEGFADVDGVFVATRWGIVEA